MSSKPLLLIAWVLLASEPNWLARALARTDPDVDAAVAAYDAGDHDLALEHLDAAVARRGERPELAYDRGLALLAKADKDGARAAFQSGTESDVTSVVASSRYQLGNLAMLDEDFETAITEYTACLRAQPDHQNAKWNLEVALLRKQEQEKKEQEQKEQEQEQEQKNDQEQNDQEQNDQEKNDQEKNDQEKNDQQQQDQQQQDQQQQDQQQQDQKQQDQKQQDQKQQDQKQQDQKQQQDQQQQDTQEQPVEAKPIEKGDLDDALEQLDRQDQFMLGRPRGNRRPVTKDW
jgi:Ca-activated chloride channel family protein